jgi:hypothetical protein
MRSILLRLALLALPISLVACGGGGNDVDPRVIPGGGVGDGAIDGEVNIHVIDADTDLPIAGAMVGVAEIEAAVDATGLVIVEDVEGAQNVAVKATGYRSAVWMGVNGANITIPMEKLTTGTVDQATLSGSITGYDTITPTAGVKAAVVLYTQTDNLGDPVNELQTPNGANICFGTTCAWTLVSRTGSLHVMAAIVQIEDPNATPTNPDDDIFTILGWASRAVTVEDGVNQSGIALDLIQTGNLENVTVDMGQPPAGLPETGAIVGIEIGEDEVAQIPVSFLSTSATALVPKLTAFPGSTYRLTAIAGTASGEEGAQSIVIHRGETATTLAAGTWLVPPTGVTATRTTASWSPVAGALVHNVAWVDASNDSLLEITAFDSTITSVTVPTLVAVPTSGTISVRVGAIAATLDVTDFSLETDDKLLTGLASQPVPLQ